MKKGVESIPIIDEYQKNLMKRKSTTTQASIVSKAAKSISNSKQSRGLGVGVGAGLSIM